MLNGLKTSLFYILCGSCRFRLAMSPASPLEVIFLAMKDIPWYEWWYAATEDGRIYTYPKKCKNTSSNFLIPQVHKLWYLFVNTHKNGKHKRMSVHRLVATTYIPNPDNKPQVNHKNSIKSDNRVENLEWVTVSENWYHAYQNWKKPTRCKPILQIDLDWNIIEEFYWKLEAERKTWCSRWFIDRCILSNV